MKYRLWRIVKYVVYPLFYLFCLLLFGYLTFPFDRLKHRIVAEFDNAQQRALRKRPSEKPMRLTIGELDGYWFSGVEVKHVTLSIPAKRKAGLGDDQPMKDSVITVDHATARLQLLPLLLGDVRIGFAAEALGGELQGTAPYRDSGDFEMELEGIQLGQLEPLRALLYGVPVFGVANGKLTFSPKNGKLAKADGNVQLQVSDMVLGEKGKDGMLRIQQAELPSAQLGQLTLEAVAKDGQLTINELNSKGRDFEMMGEGKMKLHNTWERTQSDVTLKFRFSDAYRSKNEATEGLLGKPGAKFPPAIEVAPRSPFRAAKTDDGFYRFQLSGALSRLDPKPAGKKAPKATRRSRSKRGSALRNKKVMPKIKMPAPAPPGEEKDDAE